MLIISGCAPRVVSSGPQGVSIDPVMMYPNMNKVQALADAECAKYNKLAKIQGTRSSSKDKLGWSLETIQTGRVGAGDMYASPSIGYLCVDKPEEPAPSYEWPQLQQTVP